MRKRLSKKWLPLIFAFLMASMMAAIMSGVLVWINTGWDTQFVTRWIRAYLIAAPVAFFAMLIVRPLAVFLCGLIIEK